MDEIDLDIVVKFFGRQYLTMQPVSFDKINSNLPNGEGERKALYTTVSSIYHLMKRLHHWQQAAWGSLSNFCSGSSLLTFDSHPHLTRLVLSTVTKYVKLNLLWTSFRVIPGCLAVYSFLHHVQTMNEASETSAVMYSPLEHTDHRIREFVLHFSTAPLLAIQHDFQLQVADKGASLAPLALSCFDRFEACRDLAKLRHQGVFDIESLVAGAYASHSCLPDLLSASNMADWVICVVLCVPHHLQTGDRTGSMSPRSTPSPSSLQLWHFMEVLARDRLLLTLHRNHVVNLHDLLYQQVTSSLSAAALTSGTSSSFGNRSSVPLKKTMNALSKFALRNCGVNRRQRREVATWLVQMCVQLIEHNPGLVAPSFPLLLAALTVARDEVEWATSHEDRNAPLLPSRVKNKHLQRVISTFRGADNEIAALLTSSHRLRRLLEQHSHLLADYYQEFLLNGDAHGIAYSIQELFASNDSTSELKSLLEGFLDTDRYCVQTPSRVSWVREWRQANAHLATQTPFPLLDVLRMRMECAVRHTQFICINADLIEHAAHFSKCWWFRDAVFEQCFEQALTTAPSSAVGLLEILSSLATGNDSLDELVDEEEAVQQSERIAQRLDRMQTNLVSQVELGLEAIVKRTIKLQRDTDAVAVEQKPQPLENKATASRRMSFSRVQASQVLRPSNAELRLASPTSSALTRTHENSFRAVKPDQTNDEERYLSLVRALLNHTKLHPAIVERIEAYFVRFLRGFVNFSDANGPSRTIDGVALRCSIRDRCEHVRCFLRAAQRLFGYNSNELSGLQRVSLGGAIQTALAKVLADECSAVASILPQDKRLLEWTAQSPRISAKDLEQWSLVDRISWLFVSLVTKRCQTSQTSSSAAVLMPSVLVAVSKRCFVLAPGISGELDPREYTDPAALQHLLTLIGSAGVEAVCSTIAILTVTQTLKLRSSIEAEHAALAFMDMAMSDSSSTDVTLAPAQFRALDDIANQLVHIGTAVFLLQLIHSHTSLSTSDAWSVRVDPQLLHELQQDPDRRATWARLLPVACCAGFHASVWKRTTYLYSVEATDTNAHLMGLAMAKLLPTSHSSQSVHRCAVAALKQASTCFSGSKQLHPMSFDTSTRPLLEALELLVTTSVSTSEQVEGAHGSAMGEMELSLEHMLPLAMLVLHG
ncbi:Nck-associated protein 1 [Phytophthora citrophthora]|uniref:Nck-associated protein 1 n=1 Tax=Phytophthora citrophthora TaxID=4793 RepID=A0AAD9G3Z8_9STRA|nr:Nck-associated protein 1 [Phytophthora citrophthora]